MNHAWSLRNPLGSAVLAAAVVVTLLAASPAHGEELPFRHFTPDHPRVPLPSSSVQAIRQDSLGYIWLGFFNSGLGRYDGRTVELYSTADGLADLTVREVVEDTQGYLWVGSDSGLVVSEIPLPRYRPGERVRFRSEIGAAPLTRTRMHHNFFDADDSGGLWVVTAGDGLLRYRIEEGKLVERRLRIEPSDLEPERAGSALTVRRDAAVWVATEDGSIAWLPGGAKTLELIDSSASRSPTTAFHEGRDGTLWGGRRDGTVYRVDEDGPTPRLVVVTTLLTEAVSSLHETSRGELWASSRGTGVVRLQIADPTSAELVGRRQGLLSETVWHVLVDREENLWLAHNAGVSRLRPNYRAFGQVTGHWQAGVQPLLPVPAAFAALPPGAGDTYTWVGTEGGLTALAPGDKAPGDKTATLTTDDGLLSNSVYSLRRDTEGRIWAGGPGGLNVLSFAGVAPPPMPKAATVQEGHLLGRSVTLSGIDFIGTVYATELFDLPRRDASALPSVWVCGTGGLAVHADGRWFFARTAAGLPGAGVTHPAFEPSGRVWLGTKDSGILVSREPLTLELLAELTDDHGEVQEPLFEPFWDPSNGAPTSNVQNLLAFPAPAESPKLWAGTSAGLFALDSNDAQILHRLDSSRGDLGGDYVMGMTRASGSLWVTQNAGLAEIDPVDGHVLRRLSKLDGLVSNEAWVAYALASDETGVLYLATPKGLSIYRQELDETDVAKPRLALRNALFQQNFSGENELTVDYAALYFINEQQVRYRTRVVGLDDNWSEPTTEVTFHYTNFPTLGFVRAYTFEVTATVDAATWLEEPLRYSFRARPAWWLTWWAGLLYAVGFGTSVHLWNGRRTAELKQRARDLEELFSKRTASVRQHTRELETLDQIVQTINREVGLEKVMESVLEQGLKLVPQAAKGVFSTFDREHDHFEIVTTSGWNTGLLTGVTLSVEDSMRRYSQEAERLDEGIFLVRSPEARPGAEKMRHVPRAEALVSIEVTLAEKVEGFLIFDIFSSAEEIERLDVRTLRRYRQHAISALTKARVLAELEDKNREVEQASRAKSSFLATMSHELRTPLNSIIGFSQILLERLKDGEPRHLKFLHNIHSAGEHLLSLINDILDLSKIEAGHAEIEFEEVAVDTLVMGVVMMMKSQAEERGIELHTELPPKLQSVTTDGVKLKQILYNLVSNAVKFSPEGGPVDIILSLYDKNANPLDCEAFEISVADRGIGIHEDEQERVFEEFQQVSSSTSRQFPGTGLGLTLVRRYTELLGGRVSLRSAQGQGSTFRILLPVKGLP
jgi:signal transduction histidine kinase/ligand-binding sensor domain-containing protein